MSTAASARGWGPGWPDCQKSKMVTIHAGGIALSVRAEVAPIFKGFCDELVQRGYPLSGVADDWGFACRPIRGTKATPSNHSWGLAIDLNSTANPMGSHLVSDFPQWAIDLGEKKYGLSWGGRYKSNPDAMHWEFLGTPAQAQQIVAMLAALPASEQPPESQEDFMSALSTDEQRRVLAAADKMLSAVDGILGTLTYLVKQTGADTVDEVALAEALAPLIAPQLEGVTGDQIEQALRNVFADASKPG